MDFGYTLGAGGGGNCDNCTWERGFVLSPSHAGVGIMGAQPFNLVFNHVRWNNFIGPQISGAAGAVSHGAVVEIVYDWTTPIAQAGFTSMIFNGGEIENFAVLCKNFASTFVAVTVNHVEWEGMKRIWDQPSFSGLSGTVSINGGRYDTNQIGKPVYQLDKANASSVYIAANDHRFIVERGGVAFSLNGVNIGAFGPIADDRDAAAALNLHNQFSAAGCTFPNLNPVDRGGENGGGAFSAGGTYIHGCKAFDSRSTLGGNTVPVPPRFGCTNPDGQVVISGTAAPATASVTFAKPELGNNGLSPNPRYLVFLTVIASSGSPVAGAFRSRAESISSSGFNIVLEAAPGDGASVTVAYQLRLNPTGLVS
jgi:hypothetical protein